MAEFDFASAREIQHPCHPHILELTTLRGRGAIENYCRGCMRPIGEGLAYHCQPCDFLLHLSCSQIPQQMNHPADSHILYLLSQPWNYGSSGCRCNACWQPISHGFSFHCSICRLDLHPSCANLPLRFNHPHHPQHTLSLSFIPPYQSRAFICNICQRDGGSWHYHCSECHYDSHVNCTQIPSLRESLLNYTSQDIYRRYVNYDGGRMGGYTSTRSGPGHLERGFLGHQIQQHQRPPFQHPYDMRGNMFVRPVIAAIMQTVLGSILQSFMNPGGGGNGLGVLEGLNGFADFSDVIGSLFGFGIF